MALGERPISPDKLLDLLKLRHLGISGKQSKSIKKETPYQRKSNALTID